MDLLTTSIPGCYRLRPPVHHDARGRFVKTYLRPDFVRYGLETEFVEEFHTTSGAGVLRGLHFQLPPFDHIKVVNCLAGEVFDVVVDLRRDSPAFRRFESFRLDEVEGEVLYLPRGVAHGFLVVRAPAVVAYRTSSQYTPHADAGIHWNSAGIDWPLDTAPVTSVRDEALPELSDFTSPFTLVPNLAAEVRDWRERTPVSPRDIG